MRSLLLVLALACLLIVPAPALAQGFPAGDQYGQDNRLGFNAAHDAMVASGAIWSNSQEAQATEDNDASAAAEPSGASGELGSTSGETQNAEGSAEGSAEAEDDGSGTAAENGEIASTGETQGESAGASDLKKLPQTGGPSPLWLGLPLACAVGLLVRRIRST